MRTLPPPRFRVLFPLLCFVFPVLAFALPHGVRPTTPGPVAHCPGRLRGGPILTPAAFAGHWTGDWNNTTFGSNGSVTLDSSTNTAAQTYTATLTLGGNVFGGSPPPPQNFGGSVVSLTGTYTFNSLAFGSVTFTFGANGAISGSATGIPSAFVSRVDFTGTITSTTISLDYTITFTQSAGGGQAFGTVLLTKT